MMIIAGNYFDEKLPRPCLAISESKVPAVVGNGALARNLDQDARVILIADLKCSDLVIDIFSRRIFLYFSDVNIIFMRYKFNKLVKQCLAL